MACIFLSLTAIILVITYATLKDFTVGSMCEKSKNCLKVSFLVVFNVGMHQTDSSI